MDVEAQLLANGSNNTAFSPDNSITSSSCEDAILIKPVIASGTECFQEAALSRERHISANKTVLQTSVFEQTSDEICRFGVSNRQ